MKKQPLLILSAFVLFFSLATSCKNECKTGSGKTVSENRKVDDFNKINVSVAYTSVRMILKQGNPSIKITADDNLLKITKTDVSGDELKITTDGTICNAQALVVEISNPNYSSVKSTGAIELSSDTTLNVKDFDLALSGKSNIDLALNASNVSVVSSGSATINLKGQAAANNVTLSGSSNLNAFDFAVANYKIETHGVANCKINVLSDLNVNINGAGEVQYKGNPTKIDNNHAEAARIKKVQ